MKSPCPFRLSGEYDNEFKSFKFSSKYCFTSKIQTSTNYICGNILGQKESQKHASEIDAALK